VWNQQANHQCIALRDVRVPVRVGVYAAEHARPQQLSIDVELYRRLDRLASPALGECLDYDRIYHHLTKEWPVREHVELLEVLAEGLVEFCLSDRRVEACRVAIRKPEVYPGSATPEVAVFRAGAT
jgi:7,8-dihydroneopterin aldolase/epimerase/oxygenase